MDCDNGVVSEISDDKELLNLETVIPPPPNDSGHEFIGPSSGPPQVTITPSGVQSGEKSCRERVTVASSFGRFTRFWFSHHNAQGF